MDADHVETTAVLWVTQAPPRNGQELFAIKADDVDQSRWSVVGAPLADAAPQLREIVLAAINSLRPPVLELH